MTILKIRNLKAVPLFILCYYSISHQKYKYVLEKPEAAKYVKWLVCFQNKSHSQRAFLS